MRQIICLFFSALVFCCKAQTPHCATQLGEAQLKELRAFQQRLELGQVSLGKGNVQYVPLKVHIVGNSEGKGYYSVHAVMQALCDINQDYIPTGFHFYMADSIDYINDNDLYQGNSDAIWTRAESYKMEGVVNVFFHGSGVQWCGVYFPGVDVVFIKNSCQGPDQTTLTHELGHFFSLPHTFSGWENDVVPTNIETVNGSNCRSAGDGFCDTKPDYVSQRWMCPLYWNLVDPDNISFKPDSSIYMSYAYDACQGRFSEEQMAAMRNNLQNRGIAGSTQNTATLPAPQLTWPANGDTMQNAAAVTLKWKPVAGAYAYHLQVARMGAWEYLNIDKLVYDTNAVVELYGKWPYAWRVRAITAANACSVFGAPDTFTTYELPLGVSEIKMDDNSIQVFPNPVDANQLLEVRAPMYAALSIVNMVGQCMVQKTITQPVTALQLPEAGMYIIVVNNNGRRTVGKILVR